MPVRTSMLLCHNFVLWKWFLQYVIKEKMPKRSESQKEWKNLGTNAMSAAEQQQTTNNVN